MGNDTPRISAVVQRDLGCLPKRPPCMHHHRGGVSAGPKERSCARTGVLCTKKATPEENHRGKKRPPKGPCQQLYSGPREGGAVSYERGTHVPAFPPSMNELTCSTHPVNSVFPSQTPNESNRCYSLSHCSGLILEFECLDRAIAQSPDSI